MYVFVCVRVVHVICVCVVCVYRFVCVCACVCIPNCASIKMQRGIFTSYSFAEFEHCMLLQCSLFYAVLLYMLYLAIILSHSRISLKNDH